MAADGARRHRLLMLALLALPWLVVQALSQPVDSLPADTAIALPSAISSSHPDQGQNARTYHVNDSTDLVFYRPRAFEYWPRAVQNLAAFPGAFFRREHLPMLGAVAVSTGVLWAADQQLCDGAQRLGNRWHISGTIDKTTTFIKIGNLPIFRGPTDLGSAMYFIGDGWVHMFITGGFYAYGLAAKDNRALQTTSQLLQGLGVTGTVIQILKRTTGREAPCRATAPRGVWRPFPNQGKFNKQMPKYDAYPSGHLATAMMTLTVISGNYPEKKYIKPLGYSLMAILSYQMLNNGVHWASDYPLGLAIGYTVGQISLSRGRKVVRKNREAGSRRDPDSIGWFQVAPVLQDGALGLVLQRRLW